MPATFNIRSEPSSAPDARAWPDGENDSAVTADFWASHAPSGVPSGILQRRTVPSSPPDASRRPSGEAARQRTFWKGHGEKVRCLASVGRGSQAAHLLAVAFPEAT